MFDHIICPFSFEYCGGENSLHISNKETELLGHLYFHLCRLLWIETFFSCLICWSFNLKAKRGTRLEFSNVESC